MAIKMKAQQIFYRSYALLVGEHCDGELITIQHSKSKALAMLADCDGSCWTVVTLWGVPEHACSNDEWVRLEFLQ